MKSGTRDRVSNVEIAAAAGVSKSAVSPVLHRWEALCASTRARVNNAIRGLGSVHNRCGPDLRRAWSNVVGMAIDDLTESMPCQAGGWDRLRTAGQWLAMVNMAESTLRRAKAIARMREQEMAGIIVSAARNTPTCAYTMPGLLADDGSLGSAARRGLPLRVRQGRRPRAVNEGEIGGAGTKAQSGCADDQKTFSDSGGLNEDHETSLDVGTGVWPCSLLRGGVR